MLIYSIIHGKQFFLNFQASTPATARPPARPMTAITLSFMAPPTFSRPSRPTAAKNHMQYVIYGKNSPSDSQGQIRLGQLRTLPQAQQKTHPETDDHGRYEITCLELHRPSLSIHTPDRFFSQHGPKDMEQTTDTTDRRYFRPTGREGTLYDHGNRRSWRLNAL